MTRLRQQQRRALTRNTRTQTEREYERSVPRDRFDYDDYLAELRREREKRESKDA